ncbi:MAG TPA: fatty acid oxidation complex subunit alpha FadB [SAR324 cluster bacterium]|jgi:3-hydroxyacyl-CoA dehydrogenase/enoyl-CoA hydratase/3-hydroxybutyryl-CoA epimerase/enoyl-CoA isomerase|nr:fatty acid oxidation complex subunit alpha FadB [SAR324 cluster bacterium]MEE1576462.1 fatty acid oxidation complex subunit alpha FadB [Deltaproteobacteria bacterium]MDP6465581.1 fatty acid oxidation complex subunit alpha FadB [SAR324 cluster bacterium]MDP7335088.1 fatty acid oxidation complex subunit alpha FadB [SAR324 cluster bacterium]MDP7500038.1 fatty acid oxidation complex subunit alpha FadB [SAR324 cluster bacterium]|tara:strand:- start:2885 stop:5041 length:2157 start_codon:yes stop_codon:yes gene_type:complete
MEFNGEALQCRMIEDGVVEMTFDLQNESVNKFNRVTMEEYREVVNQLGQESGLKGLMINSAKEAFIVGADINEFLGFFQMPLDELIEQIKRQQQVFLDMENLGVPSVCAINGYALGGGFEITLASTFRIASTQAKVGLPEVKLGLLPGFGGTTRLPRLIGADNALEWAAAGDEKKPDEALKAGAVDAVVEPEQLKEASMKMLMKAIQGELNWQSRVKNKQGPLKLNENEAMMTFETARAFITQKTKGQYPSPLTIVGVMQASAGLTIREALDVEAEGFAELAKTSEARALISLFLGDQLLKKKAKTYRKTAKPVKKAAVLGAGIMGGGVAYQSAYKKIPITMKDISSSQLDLGMSEAAGILQRRVDRSRMDSRKMAETLTRITPSLSYDSLKEADLVVEAVVELEKVKRQVYQEMEEVLAEDAVLASNTSTISITKLAEGLKNPERFCGMHFFNPVHRMPLVEVIRTKQSSEEAIARTVAYAADLGKSPVVVNDCPGFLVNRVLFPYFAGFAGLIEEGVDFERIDRVMQKFGWPMGPAWLLDVVGIDTSHHAGGVLAEGYPERMSNEKANIITHMFENGRYGKKNEKGFYIHTTDKKGKPRKERDPEMGPLLEKFFGKKVEPKMTDQAIIERMMLPMLMESSRCLEDSIVENPAEVDMALVYGLGFPPFRGGIFRWADEEGLGRLASAAEQYIELSELYRPTEQILQMVSKGEVFHPI